MGDAYTFLQQQGCINMGVPAGEPDQDREPEEEPEAFPTDDDITRALQDILKNADLAVIFWSINQSAYLNDGRWPLALTPTSRIIFIAQGPS